ncbi:hypothetical protein BV372_05935 [Nostoc sp. T09]|uniref:beta strand repeat-containing protein n=1 Tax=Nostoc sp. T09 TaxID=1932621 RepID=UPI000A3BC7FE|nr:hypothetical protein [Nostoc sp. T09]OUL36730.1 hypothetical protein BV372_05935 [Nostoc sp. T09]
MKIQTSGLFKFLASTALATAGLILWPFSSAIAAPQLTITPITWNILGLDSNNVSVGPNVYMVGARVCNVGTTTATNVKATFVKDGANNPYINLQYSNILSIASLPAGSTSAANTRPPTSYSSIPNNCNDFYYNVEITRNSAAYNTTQQYHIEATADTVGVVSTPTNRELYVEKLISQNRNSVLSITGPTTVVVGQTYQYTVTGKTATGGYEQLVFSPNFPNIMFQVLGVSSTYTSPSGAQNNSVYADACGWTNDFTSSFYHNNLECNESSIPDGYSGGKAGNDVTTTYTVKVLSTGTATISNLIYDYSGSSYHYNSDFGLGVNAFTITAVNAGPPTIDLDGNNSSGAIGNDYRNGFNASGSVAAVDTDVIITDDKTNINSATIILTNHPDGNKESLSIDATAGGTISGVTASAYNSTTGQITLTGTSTIANYQKIIATLKYNNIANVSNITIASRIINVQVTDSDGLSSNTAVSTISMFPPTIDLDGNNSSGATGNDYKNNFAASGGFVTAADTDAIITDDKTNINSATITLTTRPDGNSEILSIDTTAGGTVSGVTASTYNSSTGQITLTGVTSKANYQKIIATLKYNNTTASPNTTSRIINVQVTDSDNFTSNIAVSTINILLPPTIDLDGNNSSGATGNNYKNSFTGNGAVAAADTDVTITDDKTNINSATITLTTRPDGNSEILSIDATVGGTVSGVTASAYNSSTGQITLTGTATLANYQQIIATLKYNNTAANPNTTSRTINVQLIDSDNLASNIAVSTITIGSTPKLLLVKRITRINNQDFTTVVDGRSDISTTASNYVAAPRDLDDNDAKWPSGYLRGLINGSTIKPGDDLEYTIYFLSKGLGSATNVQFCDLVPANTTFIATAFNGLTPNDGGLAGADQGIALAIGSTTPTVYLSNIQDSSERGRYYVANDPSTPSFCGNNIYGAVVVNITRSPDLPNLPQATGSGTPSNSYGFVRFRAKVK